ncbi:DUF4954 family protein [Gracilinema caldarium]|uniref:DUF4954 family protein n=1 Tax=Gracilinema caldarium (strain ATCC 51460 / DSM 7334 / H1) TaxID=744872 RepID=F8EZM5_GRAC1|nr:hypothetical protein Spica_2651 [Gracilinema caldarium DSM 7334]
MNNMHQISHIVSGKLGYGFIDSQFLPEGSDEYWQRNQQIGKNAKNWRKLRADEIAILVKNNNFCANWDDFLVSDPFNPHLIRSSQFYGLVRLGAVRENLLQYHDYKIPAGIRDSTIISCDIGDDCAIQNCPYISHYIIGNQVIISRVDEIQVSNHAKFGNGILTPGESEDVRIWIDVMNEAGGRSILPFEDMIPADAYLWATYRDDAELVTKLKDITQNQYGAGRGRYGTIGSWSVIKGCGIIKDVAIGSCAYIKGANKLKNLTILSSADEPTQIGEGVELVNGIIGYGCHIFYGCKAVRFVMGRNSNLKYGARLIHSVLGDNSTVSCCEMLNNLIFPAHEQHHNNSFLIASLVQGQSNIAAGATIGSNHNSRANDGEIRAGRGFWPGLSVTLKHPSRFASYVLIAKGDYPYELDIPLPFSLVNHDVARDRLEVMPAYFWMYNMYALERNAWKAANRDKRVVKIQQIETDYLAPDTAEEILYAMDLLELWTGRAAILAGGENPDTYTEGALRQFGRNLLAAAENRMGGLEVYTEGLERHKRPALVLKPRKAWRAYNRMLRYYALKALLAYAESRPDTRIGELLAELNEGYQKNGAQREHEWVNLGGQIVPSSRLDALRQDIRQGLLTSWDEIHARYEAMAASYRRDAAIHAWAVLLEIPPLDGSAPFTSESLMQGGDLQKLLQEGRETRRWIEAEVYKSRAKDWRDPFKKMTFRNEAEMEAVLGRVEDNPFINMARKETQAFEQRLDALETRLT